MSTIKQVSYLLHKTGLGSLLLGCLAINVLLAAAGGMVHLLMPPCPECGAKKYETFRGAGGPFVICLKCGHVF